MKIYISGPITGHVDYMEKFERMERLLRQQGHEVMNPAKICKDMPEGTTHKEYMEVAKTLLKMCEAMILMEGWDFSKGCLQEVDFALKHGITITYEGAD